ncbi:MAG: hypothetical protein ABIH86_05050, partial [Planctomycetota bacterium]
GSPEYEHVSMDEFLSREQKKQYLDVLIHPDTGNRYGFPRPKSCFDTLVGVVSNASVKLVKYALTDWVVFGILLIHDQDVIEQRIRERSISDTDFSQRMKLVKEELCEHDGFDLKISTEGTVSKTIARILEYIADL